MEQYYSPAGQFIFSLTDLDWSCKAISCTTYITEKSNKFGQWPVLVDMISLSSKNIALRNFSLCYLLRYVMYVLCFALAT